VYLISSQNVCLHFACLVPEPPRSRKRQIESDDDDDDSSLEEDEEDDDDMDGFIDDGCEDNGSTDYSFYIRKLFGYDKRRLFILLFSFDLFVISGVTTV